MMDEHVEYQPWPQIIDEISDLEQSKVWCRVHYDDDITIFSKNFKIIITPRKGEQLLN